MDGKYSQKEFIFRDGPCAKRQPPSTRSQPIIVEEKGETNEVQEHTDRTDVGTTQTTSQNAE